MEKCEHLRNICSLTTEHTAADDDHETRSKAPEQSSKWHFVNCCLKGEEKL